MLQFSALATTPRRLAPAETDTEIILYTEKEE